MKINNFLFIFALAPYLKDVVAQDGFSTGIELGNGWSKRSPAPADALEADEQCEAEDDDDAFDIVDLENLEDDDDSSDSESLEQHRRYVSERDHLIQEIARRNSHRTADSMTDDSAKPETEAQSRHHDLSTSTDASGRYSAANSVRHRYKLSGDEGYAAPGVWTAEVPNGLARRQSTELQRREPNKIKNAFKKLGQKIKKGFQKAGDGIKKAAKKVGDGVKKAAKKVGDGVKKAAKKVGDGVKKAAKKVGDGVKKAAGKVKEVAKKAGEGIKKAAKTVYNKALKPAGQFIKKHIKEIAIEAGIALGTAALGLIPGAQGAAAALQVGARVGKAAATAAKVAKGAATAAKAGKAAKAVSTAAKAAKAGATAAKEGVKQAAKQGAKQVTKESAKKAGKEVVKDAAKDVAKDQAKSKAQEKVQQKIDQKTGKPKRSLRRRIVVDVPRRMPRRRNVVEMRAFQKRYESDVLSFEGMVRRDVWGNVEGFRSF